MSKSSKILLALAIILLAVSISASYYRYVVLHDYIIKVEIDCDPSTENCFIYTCDSEEEECTGNPEEDTWYYKNFYRNAKYLPDCDPYNSNECAAFECGENELGCYEEVCSGDETCTHPDDFRAEESFIEAGTEGTDVESLDEIE
jgi:hypothetical protein